MCCGRRWAVFTQAAILAFSLFLILERGEGSEEERKKHWCERGALTGCFLFVPRAGTKPATQACVFARDRTGDLLVCGATPNLLGQGSRGVVCLVLKAELQCLQASIVAVETSGAIQVVSRKPVFFFLWKFIWAFLFHKHVSWCGSVFNHYAKYFVGLFILETHGLQFWEVILKLKEVSFLSLICLFSLWNSNFPYLFLSGFLS